MENDRIRDLLDQLGHSQKWLADKVGVKQPTISELINKPTRSSKHLHRIADVLGTTASYLAGDTDDASPTAISRTRAEEIADHLNLALIPHLELGYSMGGGSVFESYVHQGFRAFDRDWLRSVVRGSLDQLFVARGDGDSMQPTIMNGDMVLIDTSQNDVRSQDRIWALSYGELGMIKRIRRTPDGAYLISSDNPVVSPIHAVDGEMHVVGRVVWIGRQI